MSNSHSIRKDPDILNLISRLPNETALSFSDKQLRDLKVAIGTGGYRKHKLDLRGTIPVPFYPSRIYFVLLMGRNVRSLTRQEKSITLMVILLLSTLFLFLSTVLGLVALYIFKSALGINLFESFSFNIWF